MFFSNLSLEKAGSLSKKQHCCIIKLDKKEIEFKAPEKCVPACVCRP